MGAGLYPIDGCLSGSVDDIAQEAFLVAWKETARFDPDRSFGGWLRGIATNLVLNERRKSARRLRIMSSRLVDVLAANYPDDERGVTHPSGLVAALRACIGQLPERSRQIVRERYERELPIESVARTMNSSEVAMRQALSRIRQAIRTCIEGKQRTLQHEPC